MGIDVLERDEFASKHEIEVTPIEGGEGGYLVSCLGCNWDGYICTHKKFVPAVAERHLLENKRRE